MVRLVLFYTRIIVLLYSINWVSNQEPKMYREGLRCTEYIKDVVSAKQISNQRPPKTAFIRHTKKHLPCDFGGGPRYPRSG